MTISDQTLAAARQVGRWLSARAPEHQTDEAIADQVAFACELHESDDPEAVQKIGRWLAKEIAAIRADGEGTFLHDLAEEITAAIREMRVAQAEAEKPETSN